MTIKEAARTRHMVRKYSDKPIPENIIELLNERISSLNAKYGVNMSLVTGSGKALWGVMRLFVAKGVNNYLLLSAPASPKASELLGYCGIDIALYAQSLGLNSWWVSGTFNKAEAAKKSSNDAVSAGIIVLGYGLDQGAEHKSKKPFEVSSYAGIAPEWFKDGVSYALLAPTAMNKQAFMIKGVGDTVCITCSNGAFSDIDKGIVKYHFEIGAGVDNFAWVETLEY